MSTPFVLEEESITLSELAKSLKDIQKRDEELSFRAGKTNDHLNHLSLTALKKNNELFKGVDALGIPRLKPLHIHKILDVMPRNVKELNVILSGYTLTVTKENQKKIIDVLEA